MFDAPLNADEEQRLLRLARQSIIAAIAGRPAPLPPAEQLTPGLLQPMAAFVTLYHHDELRGCIGRMQYDRPVYLNVADTAVSSALHDPRFAPVDAEAVADLRLEISVFNEPQPIAQLELYDVSLHGIVMELGTAHGVFLPKVARECGWDRPKTLTMLCRKIHLPDDAWQDRAAQFKVFTAHEFGDPEGMESRLAC